jgi:hypothetical protein
MKYVLIFIISSLAYTQINAQKHDYIWLTGDYNNPGNINYGGSVLTFNNTPPTTAYQYRKLDFRTCNASICDTAGNLLCYSNGCAIAGPTNNIIENGDNINPGEVHDLWCSGTDNNYYVSGNQSAIMLPCPKSDHLFYLFHKGVENVYTPAFWVNTPHLYFSLIDMAANNGAGKVLKKNIEIMGGLLSFGDITAVKHANGFDWWIVTAEAQSSKFYSFLLTEDGIVDTLEQSIGVPYSPNEEGGGQITFSPDGTKMARTHPSYGFNIFNFNRNTGVFTSFDSIHVDYEGFFSVDSYCGFSPNSRYLYVTIALRVFQFDVTQPNIGATQVKVAEWDGFKDIIGTTFGQCQLGPDCKLYISSVDCNYYHIIHHPDEPGLACDVEQHGLYFPTPTGATMPNFPNYRLGPLSNPGAPCTAVSSSNAPLLGALPVLSVFPNPAETDIKLLLNRPLPGPVNWVLTDVTGRVLRRTVLEQADQTYQVDLGGLPHGVYFYTAEVEGRVVQSGKVVH